MLHSKVIYEGVLKAIRVRLSKLLGLLWSDSVSLFFISTFTNNVSCIWFPFRKYYINTNCNVDPSCFVIKNT